MEQQYQQMSWCQLEKGRNLILIVILNREQRTIALLELTCSLSGSAEKSHQLKLNKYTQLAIDLEEKGYKVFLVPFKVI